MTLIKRFNLLLLSALLVLSAGCVTKSTYEQHASDHAKQIQDFQENELKLTEFILGAGDSIAITVFRKRKSEHLIWMDDTIDMKVYRHEDLNGSFKLGPTGRIMLPLIGDIKAAGKSELELRDEIRQKLSKFIIDPYVTLTVNPNRDLKMEDLSMSTKIHSTGKIFFPLVGELQASGKSVFKLQDELQSKLADHLIEPQVVISVTDVQSQKIMVLGEVNSPGVFSVDSPISLLEAITKAAGATRDAEMSNVVVVRKGEKQPQVLLYDLKETLEAGILSHNIPLASGDIIYVPVTRIASVSRFFSHLSSILNPIVDLERGIIFWPDVRDVLEGEDIKSPVVTQ